MKHLTIAAVIALSPLSAHAACGDHSDKAVASCPAGQVWDAAKGNCTDAASS